MISINRAVGWAVFSVVVVTAAIAVAANRAPAPSVLTVSVNPDTSLADQEVIKRATKAFFAACPLAQYSSDIESITATMSRSSATHRVEKYGWGREIELRVKVKNNASVIPAHMRASGHTLYYYIGSGTRPGFVATKDQSILACGLPTNGGGDRFAIAPGMAGVGL